MVSAWMMGGFIPLTSLLNCQRNFNGGGLVPLNLEKVGKGAS